MQSKFKLKQRKFLKHYSQHHNLAQAAKYAGSKGKDCKSLSDCGRKLLESLGFSFQEKLNLEGLTDEALMETIKEGSKAKKPFVATWEGKITDIKELDDHPTRLKAAELIGRMKGVFIDRQELTGKDGGDITISYAPSKIATKKNKSIKLDIE